MNITQCKQFFPVRLLIDDVFDPYKHFAMEESILRLIDEGSSKATLRIRRFKPSVWLGVNQYIEEEINLAFCTQEKLPIVRRPNPGGAVYQDEGNFCFSLFFPKKAFLEEHLKLEDSNQLYTLIGEVIIDTCKEFGIKAELSGVNDVTIQGRKVYGSAQLELNTAMVHSGTFLVKADIEKMAKALQPSKLKFSDKGFTSVKERVINFTEAMKKDLSVETVYEVVIRKMAKKLRLALTKATRDFLPAEKKLGKQLYIEKYSKREWTYQEKPTVEKTVSMKIKSGILTLNATLEDDRLKTIVLTGDFLFANKKYLELLQKELQGKTKTEIIATINESELSRELKKGVILLLKELDGEKN